MTFEQLSQFCSAVESMSISKAADKLYLSHSTVSRSIAALERELGVRLLVRGRGGVSVTPAGQMLYDRGSDILRDLREAETAVRASGGKQEAVRVASVNVFCPAVYAAYRVFREKFPRCRLDIASVQPGETLDRVRRREADLGLSFSFELEGERGLVCKTVERGALCVLVAENDPLAEREHVVPEDLRSYAPILLRGLEGAALRRIRERLPMSTPGTLTAEGAEELMMMVKAGLGAAVLPEHAARQAGDGCRALPLRGVDAGYELVLFAEAERLQGAAKALMDLL